MRPGSPLDVLAMLAAFPLIGGGLYLAARLVGTSDDGAFRFSTSATAVIIVAVTLAAHQLLKQGGCRRREALLGQSVLRRASREPNLEQDERARPEKGTANYAEDTDAKARHNTCQLAIRGYP